MWLLLAFTVAGAALLSHVRTNRGRAALQESATFGPIEVRLPKGWQVTAQDRNGVARITAREPAGRDKLIITTTFSAAGFDEDEFLLRTQAIALSMGEHELVRQDEEVSVPGGKGMILHVMGVQENPIASIAIVRFESGQSVTVDLQNTGQRTSADENLLLDVTESLRPHAGARRPTNTDSVDI